MPDPIIKQFIVEGVTGFPFEMLHTDQCWPARAADAAPIAGSRAALRGRKVILATSANTPRTASAGPHLVGA